MKRIFSLLFSVLSSVALTAQNSLTVDAPRVVTTDENFRIVFTADGSMSNFNWPGSEHFTVLWGPQSGSMSSMSIVNGKRTSTHQETKTYIMQANAPGKFSLPAATAVIGGREYTTGAFTIEVVGEDPRSDAAADRGDAKPDGQPAEDDASSRYSSQEPQLAQNMGKDVFLSLTVNKSNVVKGEPLTATLKIYTRLDIQGFEDVRFPTFDGFWSKETVSPQNIEFHRENVGGTIYDGALIRKYMLIPQHTGKVVIDPAEMICLVRVQSGPSSGSFFDSFFESYQTVRKRLSTPKITINVNNLPSGAPLSFGGGVGDFDMDVKTGGGELKANEASSLIVTVSGRGNISMLEAPHIDFPVDFEVYDVKTTDNISADGTSGSRVFEFPFIPRSHGKFSMDPIAYSYYDINKGKYSTIESDVLEFDVAKGEEIEGSGVVMPGVSRRGVKDISNDIRYIVTSASGLHPSGRFFAGSPLFWGLLAVVALSFFVFSRMIGKLSVRRNDKAGIRIRRANKMARTRLRLAGDYLKKSLNSAYYEELHKAVLGYVSDKLSIPSADLSKERISESLAASGADESVTGRLLHIIDACEFARYAPDTAQAEREDLYNESLNVISELEAQVKKRTAKKGLAVSAAVLLLALNGAQLSAQDCGTLWKEASDSYAAGNYDAALDNYRRIENLGMESDNLLYNIANCYFKAGDNSRAILYYEKCLKLNPAHSDALHNVEVARSRTMDKIDKVPEFMLAEWFEKLEYSFSADVWAWLALALALVTVVLLLGFSHLSSERGRKLSFIAACCFFVFAVFSIIFSLDEKSDALKKDSAVMLQPVSTVKSSPGDAGQPVFILHEGTVVKILDNLESWVRIELSDGRQGWVQQSSLEMI